MLIKYTYLLNFISNNFFRVIKFEKYTEDEIRVNDEEKNIEMENRIDNLEENAFDVSNELDDDDDDEILIENPETN